MGADSRAVAKTREIGAWPKGDDVMRQTTEAKTIPIETNFIAERLIRTIKRITEGQQLTTADRQNIDKAKAFLLMAKTGETTTVSRSAGAASYKDVSAYASASSAFAEKPELPNTLELFEKALDELSAGHLSDAQSNLLLSFFESVKRSAQANMRARREKVITIG